MKTLFFAAILLGLTTAIQSQSIMDNLFEKYSGTEGYTSVYISKYMFDMFRSEDAVQKQDADELEQVISKLDGIKILVTDDDPATPTPVNLYKEIMKLIPSSPYKEVMVVKEKDQDIKFFVKENKDKRVAELLMVIGSPDENVLISIVGDIDMKNISKLARTMNVEGMENLDRIK
ncbi:MAG TPA: DUF4252 domain-containing protein [Bacteroidales bacterium]|jgi:hypothetical protein|nr:DUF4252 domain-containing protein [Bacteroidales bacterium]